MAGERTNLICLRVYMKRIKHSEKFYNGSVLGEGKLNVVYLLDNLLTRKNTLNTVKFHITISHAQILQELPFEPIWETSDPSLMSTGMSHTQSDM